MADSKIYLGTKHIGSLFEGTSDISIYLGTELVYPLIPVTIHYYLTFTPLENSSFSFSGTSRDNIHNSVEYSLDSGHTWTSLENGSNTPTITSGEKIMWRGINHPIGTEADAGASEDTHLGIGTFSSSGRFNAEGNSLSLLYGDDFEEQTDFNTYTWAFDALFKNCNGLVDASGLVMDGIELPTRCYRQLFSNCTNLTKAPVLMAETLSTNCYLAMFRNCTSLVNAPTLIAKTMVQGCYARMFAGCTSLVNAPTLSARVLANDCYDKIFEGCSSLNNITCLATNMTANTPTTNWVDGVAAVGVFYKPSSVNWERGNSGIPSGWIVRNA